MDHYKLRLKDPSGAEFEAEGTAEFILTEKASFLEDLKHKGAAPGQRATPGPHEAPLKADFWDKAVSLKGDLIELRIKSPEIGAADDGSGEHASGICPSPARRPDVGSSPIQPAPGR